MHHHEEKSLQRLPVRQVWEVRETLSPEPAHPAEPGTGGKRTGDAGVQGGLPGEAVYKIVEVIRYIKKYLNMCAV